MTDGREAPVPVGGEAVRRIGELPGRIFSGGGERWGWEFRQPGPVTVVPTAPEPVATIPDPAWAAEAARIRRRTGPARGWLMAGFVALLIAYPVTALYHLADILGVRYEDDATQQAALHTYLDRYPFRSNLGHYLALGNGGVAVAAVCCLAGFVAVGAWRRRIPARHQREWMAQCEAAVADYTRRLERWHDDRRAAQEQEMERVAALPLWFPLRPVSDGRVDVYGGTARGWSCLLVTAGAAVLGTGTGVTVLDLSREQVARPLRRLAERHDRRVRVVRLPADSDRLDLLAGLEPGDAAESLVEAVHGDGEGSREERSLDARILHEVCTVIAPSISLARVCAGLRALLHTEPPPRSGSVLTVEEFDRLGELFGQAVRASADVRITALEARLHSLLRFSADDGDPLTDDGGGLCVMEVGEEVGDATASLLASLLLHVVVHRTRQAPGQAPGALVVAGADLLPETHLDRLDRVARANRTRLVYLFRHVRDDAVRLLGSGGPVLLMRTGNAQEAAAAADHVGREHRFVLHQLTIGAGTDANDSHTRTYTTGTHDSTTYAGLFRVPAAETRGTHEDTATGTTRGTATSFTETAGRQRVHELTVEPEQLQKLPETAFFLVDPERREGPRARLGDCNPWLVTATGVADDPSWPSPDRRR
ncbi:hypothetical protein ACGF3G_28315 [Streptomyces sp. NPDC048179]|uniref:hypothetical protein n=1 Tax=Streptomyces sp. NPDC048179 TaxID=3365506 RepID=UPI003710D560